MTKTTITATNPETGRRESAYVFDINLNEQLGWLTAQGWTDIVCNPDDLPMASRLEMQTRLVWAFKVNGEYVREGLQSEMVLLRRADRALAMAAHTKNLATAQHRPYDWDSFS